MKERKKERERQVGTGEGGGKCIIAQWHTGGDVRDTVTVQRKKERERERELRAVEWIASELAALNWRTINKLHCC